MTYERLIGQAKAKRPEAQVQELDDVFYMRTLKKYKRIVK